MPAALVVAACMYTDASVYMLVALYAMLLLMCHISSSMHQLYMMIMDSCSGSAASTDTTAINASSVWIDARTRVSIQRLLALILQ